MKIDLNLEPKDYIKFAALVGTGLLAGFVKGPAQETKIAVIETKLETMAKDLADIKSMLLRGRR